MMKDDETFPVRTIPDKPPQPKETDISKLNEVSEDKWSISLQLNSIYKQS